MIFFLVITHISSFPEKVVWKRLDGSPGERSSRLPYGAHASQQDVGSIPIGGQAKFAAQLSEPEYSLGRPVLHEVEHELSHQLV